MEALNKPYPIILNKWKVTIIVSLFISFFLTVFQPFGLQSVEAGSKTILLSGYGLVTFIILAFSLFLLPLIFKKFFLEENWNIGKQIIWLLWIVLSISLGNYLYSALVSIIHWAGFRGFVIFFIFTFLVAVIPITATTFITQNIYLKRNLKLSDQINNEIERISPYTGKEPLITLNSGSQTFKFLPDLIIFLESEGNYVNIFHLENEHVKTTLIRNTMKNVCAEIPTKLLYKCHRAFVVNIRQIEKVKGNSHGLTLQLKHTDKQIPVSRNNTREFKELMDSLS